MSPPILHGRWSRPFARTLACAALVWVGSPSAAPPGTGSAANPPPAQAQLPVAGIKAGQPPALGGFSINSGAAKTADRTLLLAWTHQGQATHWRVSTSPNFTNTPWNPLPAALPFKWLIPEGTAEGPLTLHMQLLNDHGQSAAKSAQVEYLVPPKVLAIEVASTHNLQWPFEVRVTANVGGKFDRYRITQSQAIDFKEWTPAPTSGPLVATTWVRGVPPNGAGTLWVHVQRDGVGQHAASRSFMLGVARTDYSWGGNEALAVFKQQAKVVITKLTPGEGECLHVAYGATHSLQARSVGGALRCRFTLLEGKPLRYGWAFKSAKVSYGDGGGGAPTPAWMKPGSQCAVVEQVAGGNAPRLAIEVGFPGASSPVGSAGGWTVCQLDQLVFAGPTGWPFGEPAVRAQTLKEAMSAGSAAQEFPNLP